MSGNGLLDPGGGRTMRHLGLKGGQGHQGPKLDAPVPTFPFAGSPGERALLACAWLLDSLWRRVGPALPTQEPRGRGPGQECGWRSPGNRAWVDKGCPGEKPCCLTVSGAPHHHP